MNADRSGRLRSLVRNAIPHLFAPVLFALLIGLFFHSRAQLQFDGDEGLNLMRALLIDHGYALYDDIWSDQPPVYPHILALVFRVIGFKVGGARLISVAFACLVVWGVFQILRRLAGQVEAVVGVVLLVLLPEFLRLSVSVMVGLPAIALAIAALTFQIFWHEDRRGIWLVLSAVLLAVSIQTKLFTAILAPVFAFGILAAGISRLRSGAGSWRGITGSLLAWSLAFLLPLAIITILLIGPGNLPQLFEGHLAASEVDVFQGETYELPYHLSAARPILFLAVLGAIQAVRDRKWGLLYPLFWLLFGLVFLLYLHPIWYHHQLLVTIPAVLLAAYALVGAARWLIERGRPALDPQRGAVFQTLAVLGSIGLVMAFNPPRALDDLHLPPTFATTGLEVGALKVEMLDTVIKYAPETTWMLTDQPMIAFRARLPVPPEIAVLSRKRLETGALSEADLIRVLREYRPEQVLIARFDLPDLEAALAEDYSLELFKEGDFVLYIRRDLLDD